MAEALFSSDDFRAAREAEERLRKELEEEIRAPVGNKAQGGKPHLSGAPVTKPPAEKDAPPEEPAPGDSSSSSEDEALGFWSESPAKIKKGASKKGGKVEKKKKAKSKKSKKEAKKKGKSKKDKKKKKKSSSSSESSSTSTSSSSSVFRVAKSGNDRISQARMIQWAEDHPGKVAIELLRKMQAQVGQDGEKVKKIGTAPAVAKQYDLRVLRPLALLQGGTNPRNQREMTTLCVVLDHLALGRYREAADVVAGRLKSVETGVREGNFQNASFLELVPVNPEGLTTIDEKHMMRNEAMMSQKGTPSLDDGWQNSGKGKSKVPYQWNPAGQGNGKKGDGKGKKGAKGKKGDKKG